MDPGIKLKSPDLAASIPHLLSQLTSQEIESLGKDEGVR